MPEPIAMGPNGVDAPGSFSDRRIRLSAKPAARNIIYGPSNDSKNILRPLWETGGLMWPYTPFVNDAISVDYETYDMVHSNSPFAAFKRVSAKEIQISGVFTAQNEYESQYCIAAIHFMRTITKMYFGLGNAEKSPSAVQNRGTPPPILLLNGYGTAMFHNVPVIVTSYSIELPNDVDYVEVAFGGDAVRSPTSERVIQGAAGSARAAQDAALQDVQRINNEPAPIGATFSKEDGISAWVPSRFTLTTTVQVQNTPDRWRRQFNLDDFRTGRLIKKGGWL